LQSRLSRNLVELELAPGDTGHTAWLDPELPSTFKVMEEVWPVLRLSSAAGTSTSAAASPAGCPHELYSSYVRRVRAATAADFSDRAAQ
jgi:hypothetical protein